MFFLSGLTDLIVNALVEFQISKQKYELVEKNV